MRSRRRSFASAPSFRPVKWNEKDGRERFLPSVIRLLLFAEILHEVDQPFADVAEQFDGQQDFGLQRMLKLAESFQSSHQIVQVG
ncbi:hypothetical protein SDC9_208037 [bioreactor metagenome]|uniref:Uncharacterized protein n=1 Tax=bioreactor metagenome TaxID=1076179 RepID=A0A645JC32_9ZZZZ